MRICLNFLDSFFISPYGWLQYFLPSCGVNQFTCWLHISSSRITRQNGGQHCYLSSSCTKCFGCSSGALCDCVSIVYGVDIYDLDHVIVCLLFEIIFCLMSNFFWNSIPLALYGRHDAIKIISDVWSNVWDETAQGTEEAAIRMHIPVGYWSTILFLKYYICLSLSFNRSWFFL